MAELEKVALQVKQLRVVYDRLPVLWDVDFSIPQGKMVGILGPNGAGKSTLLSSVLGLTKSVSGEVSFFGEPRKKGKNTRIGYVPQRNSVDMDFPITVKEVVSMGCYGKKSLFQRLQDSDRKKVTAAIEQVGLTEFSNSQISALSGGQQQRAFLARALVQEADLYFLDEPFAGIDMTTEAVLVQILKSLCSLGKTVCIVHHDLHRVRDYFDWVVFLNKTLVAFGPTDEVFSKENFIQTYGDSGFFSLF